MTATQGSHALLTLHASSQAGNTTLDHGGNLILYKPAAGIIDAKMLNNSQGNIGSSVNHYQELVIDRVDTSLSSFVNGCHTPESVRRLSMSNFVLSPRVSGMPILLDAVLQGRIRQLRLLLQAGVEVNHCDRNTGQSALMTAMFIDNYKVRQSVVRILLEFGADAKKKDNIGRTVMSWACLEGKQDCVSLFLNRVSLHIPVDTVDVYGNTDLALAAMSGNETILRIMLQVFMKRRLNINQKNRYGENALSICRAMGNKRCEEIIITEGLAKPEMLKRENTSSDHLAHLPSVSRDRPRGNKATPIHKLFNIYSQQLSPSYPEQTKSSQSSQISLPRIVMSSE